MILSWSLLFLYSHVITGGPDFCTGLLSKNHLRTILKVGVSPRFLLSRFTHLYDKIAVDPESFFEIYIFLVSFLLRKKYCTNYGEISTGEL